ncbi:hypothetical protein PVPAM_080010900 [Plasmodium vivax]|nr:hypothetical protein PVPAM_080010900 [Plasmodium vivax]
MTCKTKTEPDSYNFFQNINTYTKNAEKVFSGNPPALSSNGCNSFSIEYQSIDAEIAKDICERFTKLYISLNPYKNNGECDPNNKNDCKFLNYWLNSKLRESKKYRNVCVNEFYNNMERQCRDIIPVDKPLNFIYDINGDDLNEMNKLYKLHEHISIIQKILINKLEEEAKSLTLPNEYLSSYREIRYNCTGNNSIFCESLENFKNFYEQLYNLAQVKGEKYSKYVIKLTEGNNNIILTPLLCTVGGLIPLLGILYKFTPMGQLFRSKNKTFPKEYSNNDDEQMSLHQDRYNIKYHSVAE